MARSSNPSIATPGARLLTFATVCIVVAALYFARDVLMPLALAMLVSFLLTPIVRRLERLWLGRVGAVVVVVGALFLLITLLGYIVAQQLYDLGENVNTYSRNIAAKVQAVRPGRDGLLSKLSNAADELKAQLESDAPASAPSTAPSGEAASGAAPAEWIAQPNADGRRGLKTGRAGLPPPNSTPGEALHGPAGATAAADRADWSPDNPLPVVHVTRRAGPLDALSPYLGLALGPLGTAGIVVVFVIFMLLQREDLRSRLIRLISSGTHGQLTIATQALDDALSRISRFLLAQAVVNATYGLAIALGLWLIGFTIGRRDPAGVDTFPNIALWALLCAILRFIPYVGPWIAASMPLALALAVYQGASVFVACTLLFVVIELLSNNVMEPLIYGSSTGLSTVAVLVSAVFWTWLWGPIGLVMATPLTAVLVVIGKYVPQFGFLDVLLGDEPVLAPPERLYQRMLALDSDECVEVAREYRESSGSLVAVYDELLVPALAMAERDRSQGTLDDRRDGFVRQTVRDIIDELGDEERADIERAPSGQIAEGVHRSTAPQSAPAVSNRAALGGVQVACLPAHDEADEIVATMLSQLLRDRGYGARPIAHSALASEMVQHVRDAHADIVVISALPPSTVAHARYLCKRVRAIDEAIRIVVGLWTLKADEKSLQRRFNAVGTSDVSTSLRNTLDRIYELSQPLVVSSSREQQTDSPGNGHERAAISPS